MPITDYFLLWKVTVPSSWLAAIAGFLLAWLAVRLKYGKRTADVAGDAIFIILVVWKLSVVVTDFNVVKSAPTAILYFNGGLWGFVAGIAAAGVWLMMTRKPLPASVMEGLLLAAIIAQSGYQLVMALLYDGGLADKLPTLLLFTAFAVVSYIYTAREAVPIIYAAGLFAAVHAFIAAWQPAGFSGIPFAATTTVSAAAVLVHKSLAKRESRMEESHE